LDDVIISLQGRGKYDWAKIEVSYLLDFSVDLSEFLVIFLGIFGGLSQSSTKILDLFLNMRLIFYTKTLGFPDIKPSFTFAELPISGNVIILGVF